MKDITIQLQKQSSVGSPSLLEDHFPIPWSMSRAEKYCIIQLLQNIKPKIAIEIGTYNGGSLQVLSKYSEKVYALDMTPEYRDERCNALKNVDYIIGDSKKTLPQLINTLNSENTPVEFILIDGDHSRKGVLEDIKNCLNYIPKTKLQIILHDSFNPECRNGMRDFPYANNLHVHYVELDFIGGVFNHDNLYREMWGGLATIILLPEKRNYSLNINETQKLKFDVVYKKSIHRIKKIALPLKFIYNLFRKNKKGV